MESRLPMPISENQELGISNGKDRISNLPDAVLCYILSFLPTKYAVGTSILSTRWKYVWTSIPNLDFDDHLMVHRGRDHNEYPGLMRCFMNFVDRVLMLRNVTCINKFRLSCYGTCDASRFHAWTCAAITCNVQELDLRCPVVPSIDLPCSWSLLTCKTLVVLKLSGRFVLNVPTYICFPSLKTLHLHSVIYLDDATIQKFISSCSVLEELDIGRRKSDNVRVFNVSSRSLKRLLICFDLEESKYMANCEYKIVVDAPNLEYLKLNDCMTENYSVNNLSSLVEARLHVEKAYESFVEDRVYGDRLFGLLRAISNAKFVFLSGDTIEFLRFAGDYNFPTFHNLAHLELGADLINGWYLLPNILESSPNLEVLVFDEGLVPTDFLGGKYFDFNWNPPQCVPHCLLLHLKTIEIHGFVGEKDELKLVKYLLKNAKVLEKMTVRCYFKKLNSKNRKKLLMFRDKLSEFPWGSTTCQLNFIVSSRNHEYSLFVEPCVAESPT